METKIGIEIFGGHASEGYKRCKEDIDSIVKEIEKLLNCG
jgi:hypothetical protein